MIGNENLVAGFQVHAFDDDVGPFAGVACNRDLVGGHTQHARDLSAQTLAHRFVLGAVLEGGIGLEVAHEFGVTVEDRSRGRADVGRVEVDQILLERKLALDERPISFVIGIRCAGSGSQCRGECGP